MENFVLFDRAKIIDKTSEDHIYPAKKYKALSCCQLRVQVQLKMLLRGVKTADVCEVEKAECVWFMVNNACTMNLW